MAEITMPATEAQVAGAQDDERMSYECAFHILPTVAEGEVQGVFDEIKALITKAEGEITDEEMPEKIDLAYEIVKPIEGKNRKFPTAYFGWIRFKLDASKLGEVTEAIDTKSTLLRYLMIKLTRIEEENPFRFHESRKSIKMVEVVDENAGVIAEKQTEVEENVEVSEEALDESLGRITSDDDEADPLVNPEK